MVPETGVYYIALAGHNEFECGLCAVGVVGTDEDSVVSVLDFSGESVFQPREGHLWKWDANSGALTLKVGFYFLNGDAVRDDIIILPAGSTVLIAGKAKIVNGIDGGIQTSGGGFPDDLSRYRLIVHCGGCMLNQAEMQSRLKKAHEQNIPMSNYGTTIAYIHGILNRTLHVFSDF